MLPNQGSQLGTQRGWWEHTVGPGHVRSGAGTAEAVALSGKAEPLASQALLDTHAAAYG